MADPLLIRTYHSEYLFSLVFYSPLKNDGRGRMCFATMFFFHPYFSIYAMIVLFTNENEPCNQKVLAVSAGKDFSLFGADDGNRTHLSSLGSSRSTNELHPHMEFL